LQENKYFYRRTARRACFSLFTKFLAETIALDENNNQYFISTHNPYLLLSILEKSREKDLGILITYFEDYQTKVKLLNEEDIEEIMNLGIDVFFNIQRFLNIEESH
jgi:AAA15 family ATPase/GTPase